MKKKVFVILNRLVIGGQTLDTIPLLYHLKDDFDLLIFYGNKEKDEQEAAFLFDKFKGLNVTCMPQFRRKLNLIADTRAFFFILNSIRKFKPDVVHTHGLKSGVMGRIAAYITGIKCIVHTFHGHHFHSYFGKFVSSVIILMERFLATITTKIIAISTEQQNELAVKYKIAPAEKILVIPLGIDEKLFTRNGEAAGRGFRSGFAVDENTVATGIIGRIVPVKNYGLFVEVAARVIEKAGKGKKIKFFVIGDGGEKTRAQAGFDERGISWCSNDNLNSTASVIFTSWIPDVAAALHAMDIVMLTSHNEGTPLSLIEAQYCGKPVVATNVGGVKDTFVDGETGFLVPPGDADAFAAKLELLVNDEMLRNNMGNKAADFAAKKFSKEKETASFRSLYQFCTK